MLDRFAKFSYSISEIHRCWHKLAAEELAPYGLNSPHAIYLKTLFDAEPEGITAAQLGEICGKDKADVSRMVAILEQKGLVRKVAVGKNMYRAKLVLTDAGREIAEKIFNRHTLISRMLIRLGVSPETAAADACKMEHGISDESFEAIKKHMSQYEQ